MNKYRVYVETSVWSHVFADDSPDYQADTLDFFEACREGRFGAFVSAVVLQEVSKADDELRAKLENLISTISPLVLEIDEEVTKLAESFISEGAVPASKPEDATHVAVAFRRELDVLVSWNFRHIVNIRRSEKFNAIAMLRGYQKPLRIVTPVEVLYADEAEET